MIDLPIALIGDVKVKLVLIATQNIMMDIYGDLMVIAGGIYEWAPDQSH